MQSLAVIHTYAAPTGDETLTEDDTFEVLEELLPAQNQSFVLGLKLKLQVHDVEAIYTKYSEPSDRLLHVIIAVLRQAEPGPTWRAIINALKNPVIGLAALAKRLEAAHFHVVAETTGMSPMTLAPPISDWCIIVMSLSSQTQSLQTTLLLVMMRSSQSILLDLILLV